MKNYDVWKIVKWNTSISTEKGLILDSLVFDSGGLALNLSSESGKRYQLLLKTDCSFHVIDEGYRNDLWERIDAKDERELGNTWVVGNTDFLEFISMDCIF